jgi:hypothetical protein
MPGILMPSLAVMRWSWAGFCLFTEKRMPGSASSTGKIGCVAGRHWDVDAVAGVGVILGGQGSQGPAWVAVFGFLASLFSAGLEQLASQTGTVEGLSWN